MAKKVSGRTNKKDDYSKEKNIARLTYCSVWGLQDKTQRNLPNLYSLQHADTSTP